MNCTGFATRSPWICLGKIHPAHAEAMVGCRLPECQIARAVRRYKSTRVQKYNGTVVQRYSGTTVQRYNLVKDSSVRVGPRERRAAPLTI